MSEFDDLMRQKAVALKYNPDKNGAPVIVASGMGYLAEKITETAMEAGIPVYEDDSLATLLTQLKLGAEIPKELYQAIVDIYIYFLGYVPGREEENDAQTGAEAGDTEEQTQEMEPGAGASQTSQGIQNVTGPPVRNAGVGQTAQGVQNASGVQGRSRGFNQAASGVSRGTSARNGVQNTGAAGRAGQGRTGARGQGAPGSNAPGRIS